MKTMFVHGLPNTLVLSTAQVTVLAQLSNTRKGTVTMTTRDHSGHEWMEEGNEVNLQMDHRATLYILLVTLLMI